MKSDTKNSGAIEAARARVRYQADQLRLAREALCALEDSLPEAERESVRQAAEKRLESRKVK